MDSIDNSVTVEKPLITGTDSKMVVTTKLDLGTIQCYEHYHLYENAKRLYHEKPFEFGNFFGSFKGKVIVFHHDMHPSSFGSNGKYKHNPLVLY